MNWTKVRPEWWLFSEGHHFELIPAADFPREELVLPGKVLVEEKNVARHGLLMEDGMEPDGDGACDDFGSIF